MALYMDPFFPGCLKSNSFLEIPDLREKKIFFGLVVN